MKNNRLNTPLNRFNRFWVNVLVKSVLYSVGASLVLVVFVSSLPLLFIDVLLGEYDFDELPQSEV